MNRKKYYIESLSNSFDKFGHFCKITNTSIHLRNIAIIISNKIFKHKYCRPAFKNWHTLLVGAFWISSKFYEDDPITLSDIINSEFNLINHPEFYDLSITEKYKKIIKMELQILQLIDYRIPRIKDIEIISDMDNHYNNY